MEYTYSCQHCGDAVTSSRRRSGSINCHACASAKNSAIDRSRTDYAALLTGFEKAAGQGMKGEEFRTFAQAEANGTLEQYKQERAARVQREQEDQQRRNAYYAERARINKILNAHGYVWRKTETYVDDEICIPNWTLFTTDGDVTTVKAALASIEGRPAPAEIPAQSTIMETIDGLREMHDRMADDDGYYEGWDA